jgi:hypothetical protein
MIPGYLNGARFVELPEGDQEPGAPVNRCDSSLTVWIKFPDLAPEQQSARVLQQLINTLEIQARLYGEERAKRIIGVVQIYRGLAEQLERQAEQVEGQASSRMTELITAHKKKWMSSPDTDAKYQACMNYIQANPQYSEFERQVQQHQKKCVTAREATAGGLLHTFIFIVNMIAMLVKDRTEENLIAGIPMLAATLWCWVRMTIWYADAYTPCMLWIEFILGSSVIYSLYIWPLVGKLFGSYMYITYIMQISYTRTIHK